MIDSKKIKVKLKAKDPINNDLEKEFKEAEIGKSNIVPYDAKDEALKRIEEKVDSMYSLMKQIKSMLESANAPKSMDFLKKFG